MEYSLENDLEIEKKIGEIVELDKSYVIRIGTLLKEVFKIRCKQMKNYNYADLLNEKNIDFTYEELHIYLSAGHLTKASLELIKEGKLGSRFACLCIRRSQAMREEETQNRIFKQYIEENLTKQAVKLMLMEVNNDLLKIGTLRESYSSNVLLEVSQAINRVTYLINQVDKHRSFFEMPSKSRNIFISKVEELYFKIGELTKVEEIVGEEK